MSKFNMLTLREILNPETGEVVKVESSKTFTTKVTEDTFYMTFIDYISPIFGLKPDKARDLLLWMCKNAEFNTGRIKLTTEDRRILSNELKISNNLITNYLKKLRDKKLINGEKGNFIINPLIFWKGELGARKELLKDATIKVTFSIE